MKLGLFVISSLVYQITEAFRLQLKLWNKYLFSVICFLFIDDLAEKLPEAEPEPEPEPEQESPIFLGPHRKSLVTRTRMG